MEKKGKKLPGALLFLLSALGIMFGLATAGSALKILFTVSNLPLEPSGLWTLLPPAGLALTIGALQVPLAIAAWKRIRGRPISAPQPSLFRASQTALVVWVFLLIGGFFLSREQNVPASLAVVTIAAVLLPVWFLVEFFRRNLPRSTTLREWGSLSIGLSIAPVMILVLESAILIAAALAMAITLGFNTNFLSQIQQLPLEMMPGQNSLESLETALYTLAQNPVIAAGILLVLGGIAPFVEELFKPMAVWFLLKRPLTNREGYTLGLISGGAFALLESLGVINQISGTEWIAAILLRAGTGVLHIGLSGLVGYGLVKSFNEKRFERYALYQLAATALHGGWNSLALATGFSAAHVPENIINGNNWLLQTAAVALMGAIFITIILINLKIQRTLRAQISEPVI